MVRDTLAPRDSNEPRGATERAFDAGRAAWPQIALDFETFARCFARHAQSESPPRDTHARDMYLAYACAYRIERALAEFERAFAGDMARAVASIDSSRAFVEEILQVVRERLFVCKGGEPGKIVDYAGRASLKSWLAAVAVRSAISWRRRKGEQRHTSFTAEDDRRLASGGPEFEYLRGRYKDVFEEAVRAAINQLPAKERMLLRLNLVDGVGIDELGTTYRVGRSTAARWLAAARKALLIQARHELHEKLRLTSSELDGLAADMRSQLDVSVFQLLVSTKPGA